jgi:hypothetical protein
MVMRKEREADHSPPSSAEVRIGEAIPPLTHMSSWHSFLLIMRKDNFTLPYLKSIHMQAMLYVILLQRNCVDG